MKKKIETRTEQKANAAKLSKWWQSPQKGEKLPKKAAQAMTHPVGDHHLPRTAQNRNITLCRCWLWESTLRNKQNKKKEKE